MTAEQPSNVRETALGAWLRAASTEDQKELARMAECSVHYLRILAGVHRENPRLRRSLALVHGVAVLNQRHNSKNPDNPYPSVTLADLASPTRRDNQNSNLAVRVLSKD